MARSLITATKITTSVGSSTSDLQLRHKTYHHVDFQAIYTKPLGSSSSNHPCIATRRSKIQQLFHVPHAPSLLLRSTHSMPPSKSSFFNLHHRRRIGLIGLPTRPHTPTKSPARIESRASHATGHLWCHRWRHHYTSASMPALADVFNLRHLADIIVVVDHWLWLWLLIVDFFSELTFCSPGAPCLVFCVDFIFAVHFCIFCF